MAVFEGPVQNMIRPRHFNCAGPPSLHSGSSLFELFLQSSMSSTPLSPTANRVALMAHMPSVSFDRTTPRNALMCAKLTPGATSKHGLALYPGSLCSST